MLDVSIWLPGKIPASLSSNLYGFWQNAKKALNTRSVVRVFLMFVVMLSMGGNLYIQNYFKIFNTYYTTIGASNL
jgi:hypothetical protein